MKAILFFNEAGAMPMAQVLDRPLIQHMVEQLVERGVREICLLYGAGHEAAAEHLGDGTRWGIRVEAVPLFGEASKEGLARAASGSEPGLVLLGDAGRLAHLPKDLNACGPWNTLFFYEEDGVGGWSGWALLDRDLLPEFGAAAIAGSGWREAMRSAGIQARKVFLDYPCLSAASPKDVLLANRRALAGQHPGLFFNGREKTAGVWAARGSKIASSAVLHAPCYIGEDAWIGSECSIGPYAVIAAGSVIEKRTSVSGSVVGLKTFLGPELEISDSLVMRNHVHNVRLGVDFVVEEEHIVSAL